MDMATKLEMNSKESIVDISTYRGMVGCLLYLITSRHDIIFATCSYVGFRMTLESLI